MQEAESAAQRVREGVLITTDELKQVQADLQMQERIVHVLEKENEQLIQERKGYLSRLKALEAGLANSEAKFSIQHSGGSHNTSGNALGSESEVSAQLESAKVQLQELRIQLQRAQTSDMELRLELDTVKKEKRDMERRLSTCDGTKTEAAELEARALRVQLKRKDDEHAEAVRDMARKIAWYVEHQEYNRIQEETIKEQQDTIQQLRAKVMEAEALVTKSGVVRTDKDKQIRQLQRTIVELEAVIREKNPNSIAELIRSCQPPVQHAAVFKEMEGKIMALNKELQDSQHHAQQALDKLRVESDRVRSQYQNRLEKLEEEMKLRVLHAQSRKVKELEKELSDARKYYSEKLKEKETTIVLLRRGIAPSPSSASSCAAAGEQASHANPSEGGGSVARPRTSGGSATAARRGGTGHNHIATTASLRTSDTQTDLGGVNTPFPSSSLVTTTHHVPSTASPQFASTVIALQQENTLLKQQLEAMAQTAMSAAATSPNPAMSSLHLASSLQLQLQTLHNELAVHKRLLAEAHESSRQQSQDSEDRIIRLRQDHAKEMQLLRREHEETLHRLAERHDAEMRVVMDRLEIAISRQRGDVIGPNDLDAIDNMDRDERKKDHSGNRRGKNSNSAAVNEYLEHVTKRLQLLEHRQASKELEARRELEELRRIAQFEAALEKQKTELIVQQKNQEIDKFRMQLDALLSDLANLRIVQG